MEKIYHELQFIELVITEKVAQLLLHIKKLLLLYFVEEELYLLLLKVRHMGNV